MHHNRSAGDRSGDGIGCLADHQAASGDGSSQLPSSASTEKGKMAAKWQQWFPFKIDAFRGSPSVQAMHPCARAGYIYLLGAAWQTEDCTVPNNALELAEISGLGDELWALHGPRILRKFETVEGTDRLRNEVCYKEWGEAKRVFEARKDAADRTNSARSPKHIYVQSPDGHRVALPNESLRSGDTRTTVVPVPVNVPVSSSSGGNGEFMAAGWLLNELGLASAPYDVQIVAQVIQYAARDSGTDTEAASKTLLASAKAAMGVGENVNVFWFKDRKFAQGTPNGARVGSPRSKEAEDAISAAYAEQDRHGYEMWQGMSEEYRAKNPWHGGAR